MPKRRSLDYNSQCRAVAMQIRRARSAEGMTQAELGICLTPPCSHAAVSDIERGKTAITAALLFQLADLFGKPVIWFFSLMESEIGST